MTFLVIQAQTDKEIADALSIRNQVFIEEQGVDPKIELDQYDAKAIHFVGYLNQEPIAVARVQIIDHKGKIQRVAVLKSYRNKGYGKKLILAIESFLSEKQISKFYLNAQSQVIEFYQSLGYTVSSEPFYEANIQHVTMAK
ncbi:MAG: GNAT family N-acetyltransferase [Amphibacillus sp.]|nr:GNAT family N-acetyltransferase [Amphibacillus sp.]